MVSLTVLSRDRACQLDLLLRSARLLARGVDLTVLWTATTPDRRSGYDLARERFPSVRFVEEQDFPADLERLSPASGLHGWLCCDDVLVRPLAADDPVVATFAAGRRSLALSLRLHPGITEGPLRRALPRTRALRLPTGTGVEVRWPANPNVEWANPFSLDGHLYHAETVRTLLAERPAGPAELRAGQERLVGWFAGMRPRMLAWDEPRLVCVPRHADPPSTEDELLDALNERYLAGRQIRLDPFLGRTWTSARAPRSFELELRRAG